MIALESLDKNFTPIGKLVSAYDVERKRRINSDDEITFTVPMNSEDYQEKLFLKGHIEDERGQYYVIESRSRVRDDLKLLSSFYCRHIFHKLNDFKFPYTSYISEAYGVHISQLTNLITAATGGRFTFSIDDSFDLHDVKQFVTGSCMVALEEIINLYGCEMNPDNFVIHLKKKVGTDKGHQYRIKKNIVSDQFKDNTTSLTTRLFAQMKDGMTWIGQSASILSNEERALLEAVPGAIIDGVLQVNYLISPYAHVWSSESVPFFDHEIIEQDIDPSNDLNKAVSDLLEVSRKTLREKEIPEFEVSVDGADLHKIDNDETAPDLGDTVYCFDPKMEMNNMVARIIELTEYPYTKEKHAQVTISNVAKKDYDDMIANLEKSKNVVENIFSGGRVRAAAFEEFAHKAVIDINNSKTELIYPPEGGILAQDKTNPLRQVRLTSAGLGISTDGWNTLRSAITADGVLAEQVIGQFGNFVSMLIGEGNNVVQINTHGIAAGHANFSDAKFQVNMAGDVIARSIKLTGEIEQSTMKSSLIEASRIVGNEIEGGIITGSTIQTATNTRKILLNADGFRSFDGAGTRRISIDTDDNFGTQEMRYYGSDGSKSGVVSGSNGQFNVAATPQANLVLAGQNVVLGGDAEVEDFPITNKVSVGAGVNAFDLSYVPLVNCYEIDSINARISALETALAGKASASHSHSVTIPSHNHGNPANANSGGGTFGVS